MDGCKIQFVFNQRQRTAISENSNSLSEWALMVSSGQNTDLVTASTAWRWRLSGKKPPSGSYPGHHPCSWGVLPGSPPSLWSSGTPALGRCCKLGCDAASLKQFWSVLAKALARALFGLGVSRLIHAFSFPPSLSSLSVLMVLPSTAHGLSSTCVSTCLILIMFEVHVQPFHHFKKGPFPSWKLIEYSIKLVLRATP